MILRGHRKFLITVATLAGTFVLVLKGAVTGHDWIWFAGGVLGVHHASNVTDKKLGGEG